MLVRMAVSGTFVVRRRKHVLLREMRMGKGKRAVRLKTCLGSSLPASGV
jgi:hypothetical protein